MRHLTTRLLVSVPCLPLLWLAPAGLATAGLTAQRTVKVKAEDGKSEHPFVVCEPSAYRSAATYPIVLGSESLGPISDSRLRELAQGWIVARVPKTTPIAAVIRHVRLNYRVESQRMFVFGVAPKDVTDKTPRTQELLWIYERPFDFNLVSGSGLDDPGATKALREARNRTSIPDRDEQRVAEVLDDFHDCAAKADGERYFAHFAPKGVFLGTDATERWPVAEFKAFGMKYFERESAWIYVPQERNVDVVGDFAWFDEILHSDSYGECRGSGALQRIAGKWRIAQYHLTVPVPNALMREVVARIRQGAVADAAASGGKATTVFVVRHAEKQKAGDDPSLTDVGRARAQRLANHLGAVEIDAAFATQFNRTQETVAPMCSEKGLKTTVLDARADVAKRILAQHRGQAVVVAGHSNTVPRILRRLGVQKRIRLTEQDYDDLFIVTVPARGDATMLRLRY